MKQSVYSSKNQSIEELKSKMNSEGFVNVRIGLQSGKTEIPEKTETVQNTEMQTSPGLSNPQMNEEEHEENEEEDEEEDEEEEERAKDRAKERDSDFFLSSMFFKSLCVALFVRTTE